MRRILIAVFVLVLFSGCDSDINPTLTSEPIPEPAYRPIASVKQTMEWILDPAADLIWDSAGFIITAEGETDLSPTTDAGWERVRNGAVVVAETGNLLMMPGRSAGADWVAYARQLTARGELAMAAAEAQDVNLLFDAGGQIYQVCRACHEQYMVPLTQSRNPQ